MTAAISFGLIFSSAKLKNLNQGEIILGGLPERYCPKEAQLLIVAGRPLPRHILPSINQEKTRVTDRSIPIADCRRVDLRVILGKKEAVYQVYLKLPRALAFQLNVSWPTRKTVYYYPPLGDLDDNNLINDQDLELVKNELFSTAAPTSDLDGDQQVTVLDYNLVRLNQQAGESRPDGQPWRAK